MTPHSTTIPSINTVRAHFVARGTTLTHWANAQGFSQRYFWDLCKRYGGREGAWPPRGQVARKMLRELQKALSEPHPSLPSGRAAAVPSAARKGTARPGGAKSRNALRDLNKAVRKQALNGSEHE